MNALIAFVLASVAIASAVPVSLIRTLDDGQWHGEGLLESQDWASPHTAAIVAHQRVAHDGLVHDGLVHGGVVHHGVHGLSRAAVVVPSSAAIIHDVVPGHVTLGHHGIHGVGHAAVVSGPSGAIVRDVSPLTYHGIHGLEHSAVVVGHSGAIVQNVVPGHVEIGHHGHWW